MKNGKLRLRYLPGDLTPGNSDSEAEAAPAPVVKQPSKCTNNTLRSASIVDASVEAEHVGVHCGVEDELEEIRDEARTSANDEARSLLLDHSCYNAPEAETVQAGAVIATASTILRGHSDKAPSLSKKVFQAFTANHLSVGLVAILALIALLMGKFPCFYSL